MASVSLLNFCMYRPRQRRARRSRWLRGAQAGGCCSGSGLPLQAAAPANLLLQRQPVSGGRARDHAPLQDQVATAHTIPCWTMLASQSLTISSVAALSPVPRCPFCLLFSSSYSVPVPLLILALFFSSITTSFFSSSSYPPSTLRSSFPCSSPSRPPQQDDVSE